MLKLTSQRIAVIAVMAAVITVLPPWPCACRSGHAGLYQLFGRGDLFASLAFGPWIGFIASGVGTALADLIGYPATAPLTFFAHGLEGLVAGWIAWRSKSLRRMLSRPGSPAPSSWWAFTFSAKSPGLRATRCPRP